MDKNVIYQDEEQRRGSGLDRESEFCLKKLVRLESPTSIQDIKWATQDT